MGIKAVEKHMINMVTKLLNIEPSEQIFLKKQVWIIGWIIDKNKTHSNPAIKWYGMFLKIISLEFLETSFYCFWMNFKCIL